MADVVIRTSEELRRFAATDARAAVAADEFRSRFAELIHGSSDGLVRQHTFISLPAALATWVDTGIDLAAGQAVTLFSTARAIDQTQASGQTDADPQFWHRIATAAEARRGPWRRVGIGGDARRGARASCTLVAARDGRLFLAGSPTGAPALFPVDRCVLVVVWSGEPHVGLERLRAQGDVAGLVASEIARHRTRLELPDGWYYPPLAGDCEEFVHDVRPTGGPIIGCYARDRGALLQKDVDVPFLPGTTLRWAWVVQQLPSRVREDGLRTHDYLSIAVEFDNGRDLTYYWSSELPVETVYNCPVPGWAERETHIVVRSGHDGLGSWIDEERDVYGDYSRHVGEPPRAIVRIWLLASTLRQGGEGRCDYGRIEIASSSAHIRVN